MLSTCLPEYKNSIVLLFWYNLKLVAFEIIKTFLSLYIKDEELILKLCPPIAKVVLNLQNIFNFSSMTFHNLQVTLVDSVSSIVIVVLKTDFSSKSEASNTLANLMGVSLQSNSKDYYYI